MSRENPGLVAGAWTELRAMLARLSPRERRMVWLATAAVLIALLWLVLLRPALRTLREAPARLTSATAELQEMRALVDDMARLAPQAQSSVAPSVLQARERVIAVLRTPASGTGPAITALSNEPQVQVEGNQLRIRAVALQADTVLALLQALRQEMHYSVDELTVREVARPTRLSPAPSGSPSQSQQGSESRVPAGQASPSPLATPGADGPWWDVELLARKP